ncbi:hypothetical protein ADN00_12895 [Ornatilinea apprima]|uniref:Uncharacterized protein n=1 Tax=Ornatilinea apprima TaxID=1134406 RepID=A0A0P6X5V7_9CHLR|nr:hypothetical protein [Ornatilinea apprima]KPL75533.1 hypothetical protein ADN00_12895 [Ornatilinea apprima]
MKHSVHIGVYFFLLLEDYIDAQTEFVHRLDLSLERFARNLGHSGAVVKPFVGDIEATKAEVLRKSWTERELHEIRKTPGLLLINVDFVVFDPREHPWIYINLGERVQQEEPSVPRIWIDHILNKLAESANNTEKDIFQEANKILNEVPLSDVAAIFEVKPGVFGFSIDLLKGGKLLTTLFERMSSKHQ